MPAVPTLDRQIEKQKKKVTTMNDENGTSIRSVRVENDRWTNFQKLCDLPPGASASETFEKIFERFENGSKFSTEVGGLKAKIQHLEEANQRLDTTNQHLEVANLRLDTTSQQLEKSNQRLDITNQQLEKANLRSNTTNQRLIAENERLQAMNQQREAEKQHLETEKRGLESEKKKLRGFLDGKCFIRKKADIKNPYSGHVVTP